jgi:hypothetical protein
MRRRPTLQIQDGKPMLLFAFNMPNTTKPYAHEVPLGAPDGHG